MTDRKNGGYLAAKSAATLSKPLITLIYTDGGVQLARGKERSHKIQGLAFQIYQELRNGPLDEVYENAQIHGLRKKRLRFKFGVEEKLQLKTLLSRVVEGPISAYQ